MKGRYCHFSLDESPCVYFTRVLCVQLDILEYIHEHEYVHADIKASNLMLSHTEPNQVSSCQISVRVSMFEPI